MAGIWRERLDEYARERAGSISGQAPSSIAAIKQLYAHNLAIPLEEALAYEREFTPSPGVARPR